MRKIQLEDYRIAGELGRGGMGVVFHAEQLSLDRSVALKVIPHTLLDESLAIQRFELEARTAARLQHESIVPVYEVGAEEDFHWYSMRLIDGQGLDEVIKVARRLVEESGRKRQSVLEGVAGSMLSGEAVVDRQELEGLRQDTTDTGRLSRNVSGAKAGDRSLEQTSKLSSGSTTKIRSRKSYYHQVARIGQHVAEALAHAHEHGVVHRDIKPSNLLLDRKGKIWVADFGLAKTENHELTRTGDVVGTLRFLSPERLDGISDRRSDIYSLGMTMYELLALRPAFDDASKYNIIEKIRLQNPERLKSIDASVPRDLVTIIEKAIEKEPLRRFASAQLMAEDLELFLDGRPIRARRVSQWEHLWSWARRNRGIATALACIAILVLTGLVATSIAAYKFRNMAIEQKRLTGVADKESNENQQNLYYAEMKLGVEAAQSPQGRRSLSGLLANWMPQNDSNIDRRGFEWYWLNSNLNPELTKVHDAMWRGTQFNSDGTQLCR
ncbi:MAG: serine/threonine-protein kinase, partial [Planctomycetota bacterium]